MIMQVFYEQMRREKIVIRQALKNAWYHYIKSDV